jgi:hypothetical protein
MTQIIAFLLTAVVILPAAQKAGPWKSLFDGKSMNAWRIFKTDNASKEQFGDFELEFEWKIGKASNSGVFYRGTDEFNQIYWSAPEYQLLDNVDAADNKKDNHLAGSVYDLYAVPKDAARSANEWNQTRIVAKGNHVEHWLNGKNVASYDLGSADWNAAIKASKFNPEKFPSFGKAPKGYLGIQGDHPGTLELRNLRIRDLP